MAKKLRFFESVKDSFSNGWNFISNGTKTFTSKSWSHFKSKPLEIIGFVATMVALYQTYESNQMTRDSNQMTQKSLEYSQKAMKQSDFQFKENNKGQKVQGVHDQEKHDSMMSILKQQQMIGEAQLRNIKEQNLITKQIQQRQIESERPIVQLINSNLVDTIYKFEGSYRPKLINTVKNFGKRKAKNYMLRRLIIFDDETYHESKSNETFIEYDMDFHSTLITYFRNVSQFYMHLSIEYSDEQTGIIYKTVHYQKYSKQRGEFKFFECENQEITMIDRIKALNGIKW
ncbi:MAG: hypothetical protein HC833_11010 [Leptolyngbyaceae cyanobacterium RM1_406_9]|nr:hypothetical protein [Leptolyngbyaceae cyanobacterium RM1_406_9]